MKTATRITLLFLFISLFIATPALCVQINNINFNPTSPATLNFGDYVAFTYGLQLDEDSMIFGRPFTSGALTPNYAALQSTWWPAAANNGGGAFTIQDKGQAAQHVDQVRFQIFNRNQTLLLEEFVCVDYIFGPSAVPIPAAAYLLGAGFLGLLGLRRKIKG